LNASSKSFGSSDAPTSRAISTKLLKPSASVSLGLDFEADVRKLSGSVTGCNPRCGSGAKFPFGPAAVRQFRAIPLMFVPELDDFVFLSI